MRGVDAMTNIPLGDTGYEIERVRVQSVENGDTLVFDLGVGRRPSRSTAVDSSRSGTLRASWSTR